MFYIIFTQVNISFKIVLTIYREVLSSVWISTRRSMVFHHQSWLMSLLVTSCFEELLKQLKFNSYWFLHCLRVWVIDSMPITPCLISHYNFVGFYHEISSICIYFIIPSSFGPSKSLKKNPK